MTPLFLRHVGDALKIWGCTIIFFWDCWISVQSFLQELFKMDFPLDPVHYLLGLPTPGVPKHTKKLMSFILLAAKYTPVGYLLTLLHSPNW